MYLRVRTMTTKPAKIQLKRAVGWIIFMATCVDVKATRPPKMVAHFARWTYPIHMLYLTLRLSLSVGSIPGTFE